MRETHPAVRTAVLAAAPWPLGRAACSRPFWRYSRRTAAVYAAYVAAYAIAVAAVALLAPWLLVPLALVAACGTAAQMWLGRASSGSDARLPPGPLPLVPVAPIADSSFMQHHLERYGPVAKAALPTARRPVVCVDGLRRGAAVLSEHASELEWVGMTFDELIPAGFLRTMTPGDHAHYKAILRGAFADDVVTACTPDFDGFARAEVTRLAAAPQHSPGDAVDPRPALGRMSVRSFARLFLGLSPGADDLALVEPYYREPGPFYDLPAASGPRGAELGEAARAMAAIVRRRRNEIAAGGEATSFLGRLVETEPDALDDPNVVLNLVFLLATSSRDVTGLLHWIVKMLADNPAWIGRVRSDGSDLATRVVQETLRLAQSEFIGRRVVAPFELEGHAVPKGWYLRVCVQESHRSPEVFDRPETFDPDRFAGRRYTRAEYAPFGMLEHACLGVMATHAVASAFVRAYCEHDWAVSQDGAPEYDGFHWTPSRRLRVGLAPKGA